MPVRQGVNATKWMQFSFFLKIALDPQAVCLEIGVPIPEGGFGLTCGALRLNVSTCDTDKRISQEVSSVPCVSNASTEHAGFYD